MRPDADKHAVHLTLLDVDQAEVPAELTQALRTAARWQPVWIPMAQRPAILITLAAGSTAETDTDAALIWRCLRAPHPGAGRLGPYKLADMPFPLAGYLLDGAVVLSTRLNAGELSDAAQAIHHGRLLGHPLAAVTARVGGRPVASRSDGVTLTIKTHAVGEPTGYGSTIVQVPDRWYNTVSGEPTLMVQRAGQELRQMSERFVAQFREILHHAEWTLTTDPAQVRTLGLMHGSASCRAEVDQALVGLRENPEQELAVGQLWWGASLRRSPT